MFETMKETTDYSKFKLLKTNRRTNSGHVQRLKEAIKRNNLVVDFPILVDSDMNILDGQHRFEALRLLGLPICYQQAKKMSAKDIKLVNSISKKCSNEEHLDSFCEEGNEDYIKVRDFMKWAGIHLVPAAIKILVGKGIVNKEVNRTMFLQTCKTMTDFKSGNFVYPDPDTNARKIVLMLREISQFTASKNPYEKSFYVAINKIIEDEYFDYERLIIKLKQYPLGVYNDANSLIEQLEKAYNYNVRDDNQKRFLKRA